MQISLFTMSNGFMWRLKTADAVYEQEPDLE